jgi:hypothetical protein
MNERGSVILFVLVGALVAAIICASIVRTRLGPAVTAANAIQRVQNDAAAQAALNRVTQVWMSGGSCASNMSPGGPGVACAGAGCACACTVTDLTSGAVLGTVTSAPNGGACALTVSAP